VQIDEGVCVWSLAFGTCFLLQIDTGVCVWSLACGTCFFVNISDGSDIGPRRNAFAKLHFSCLLVYFYTTHLLKCAYTHTHTRSNMYTCGDGSAGFYTCGDGSTRHTYARIYIYMCIYTYIYAHKSDPNYQQESAVHHTATHCNTLRHTATH